MLFVFVSFMLIVDAADAKDWGKRIGLFALAIVLGVIGLLMLMTDKPLVIQWVLAWMTRP